MATIITEEPTTGPDTFIRRRLRKGSAATKALGIFRLREDGLWHSDRVDGEPLTWAALTEQPAGHEVTIELLAVPLADEPETEGLNLPDIERRMGLFLGAEHKWASIGGRALAMGLIQTDLPKLIALAKTATKKKDA